MSTIKIIYGVPFASSVSKEWQRVLERSNIRELDTGAVYVSALSLYFTNLSLIMKEIAWK